MAKINFKELVGKVDTKKVLNIAGIAVTVVGALISNKSQANERNALKEELKKELTEELLNGKN